MSNNIPTREQLAEVYETETGLDARRGPARIDHLEKFVSDHNLGLADIEIVNNPSKMNRDYRRGIRWGAGVMYGNTVCLGHTSGRGIGDYKNAIFTSSPKVQTDV